MDGQRKLLIIKMDALDELHEADKVAQVVGQAGAGRVVAHTVVCEQPAEAIAAAETIMPDWIHLIGRSDKHQLIFSRGEEITGQCSRISLLKKLREAAVPLTLVTLNSKLDDSDLGNMGRLYAVIGMEKGYNPVASRLFMPRFYDNICRGQTLSDAATIAIENMQQEVVQHGGMPSLCFNHIINPETFMFLPEIVQ
ncbi:hypothetical protein [Pectinatus sottacetonis]|uniref:hypothetical protein n=1 Tax=Pectinatus sottacetonis TaxID=1002795 RepID=UPI0018C7564C|nr:hypothetical protein [Pectinatus sottacetonis]